MKLSFDVLDVEQGSDEWMIARAGRVTGSNANAVVMKNLASGGEPAGKKDYRLQLAVERMTGRPQLDDFQNKHMRHGNEQEPMARVAVEQRTGLIFRETGFLRVREKMIGVSLDGDANDFKMMLELKCPKSTTHMQYLEDDRLPPVYRWQVIHGLYICGAEGCVFASYDDRMPEGLQLFTHTVYAKDLPLEEYGKSLDTFLASVDELHQKLQRIQKERIDAGK